MQVKTINIRLLKNMLIGNANYLLVILMTYVQIRLQRKRERERETERQRCINNTIKIINAIKKR